MLRQLSYTGPGARGAARRAARGQSALHRRQAAARAKRSHAVHDDMCATHALEQLGPDVAHPLQAISGKDAHQNVAPGNEFCPMATHALLSKKRRH